MSDSDHSHQRAPNQPVAPSPNNAFNSEELSFAVDLVINHLRRESDYLDTVIACSLKMKDVLRDRPTNLHAENAAASAAFADSPASEQAAPEQTPVAPQTHEKLDAMRGDLARQFVPVLEGRQQMKSALQEFKPYLDTPTVSSLAPKLNEPARHELKQLRNDIRAKLNEVRAITMGNQAVLIYTMDFYHRLLTGLSNNVEPAKAYNKSGKLTNQVGGGMLQKEC